MLSSLCLLCLAVLLISIGVVFGMRLGEMKGSELERVNERHAERARIARDLHDTLLQSVQALLFRLQIWSCDTGIPEERRAEISAVVMEARGCVVDCIDRLRGLRSGDGERVDLVAALGSAASAESAGENRCFKVTCTGERRTLRPEAYDQLLDIGREAVRNAYRHSRACHIQVTLEYRKKSLRLQIVDDGCGICPSIVHCQPSAGHFGLIGMRERAAQLGAQLLITTNGGAGTRIALTIAGRVAFLTQQAPLWRPTRQESWTVDEAAS
jgi:signal transduction histidine kinase